MVQPVKGVPVSLWMLGNVVLLILIIIAGTIGVASPRQTSTGSSSSSCLIVPASPCWTQVQYGTLSCSITGTGSSCAQTFTFNPAYSVKPKVSTSLNLTSFNRAKTQTLATSPEYYWFQSPGALPGVGVTWVNMPSAVTELYGGTDNEVQWDWVNNYVSSAALVDFCVNLVTNDPFGDGTADDILFPQYSSNGGGTWTILSANLAVDISIPGGGGPPACSGQSVVTLPSSGSLLLRVVGQHGSGGLQNPAFSAIYMTIQGNISFNVSVTCTPGYTALTTTSVSINVSCPGPDVSATTAYRVDWWAGIPA